MLERTTGLHVQGLQVRPEGTPELRMGVGGENISPAPERTITAEGEGPQCCIGREELTDWIRPDICLVQCPVCDSSQDQPSQRKEQNTP